MEQIHDLLEYKNLKIVQDSNLFKFSLDSILLANFVTVKMRCHKILDIGTGNAPIPLILSTKTKANIVGVELQKESYKLARKTLEINQLEKRIEIIHQDIHTFYKNTESDTYDVITCNPPFFKYQESSIINDSICKTIARHEKTLTIESILLIAKKLLKNNGTIALVHRTERMIEIIEKMKKNNIEPKKIQFVYPYIGKESNMLLIEGTKNGKTGVKVMDPLYVYDHNGQYTEEMKKRFH